MQCLLTDASLPAPPRLALAHLLRAAASSWRQACLLWTHAGEEVAGEGRTGNAGTCSSSTYKSCNRTCVCVFVGIR